MRYEDKYETCYSYSVNSVYKGKMFSFVYNLTELDLNLQINTILHVQSQEF